MPPHIGLKLVEPFAVSQTLSLSVPLQLAAAAHSSTYLYIGEWSTKDDGHAWANGNDGNLYF